MLDTGIDVPEVVNLVFFKPVRSKTKFWQMLGRGTRLCSDLFGPGKDKKDFYIFDFCGNLEFFGGDQPGAEGSLQKSLNQRLFETRLGLITELDTRHKPDGTEPPEGSGDQTEPGLRFDTARQLHTAVAGMVLDNFLVRPHRKLVEKYSQWSAWTPMTLEAAGEVAENLAGLPTTHKDSDEDAKRFDLLILRRQLADLQGDTGASDRLRLRVQEIATGLLGKTTIPAVAAEQELLDEVASDEWWVDVTLPMLESARRRLRGLPQFLDKAKKNIVYTHFQDELFDPEFIELPVFTPGTDMERFQAKAAAYLKAHQDHVALQRLRRNKQLTPDDLQALEQMLVESGAGDTAAITQAKEESNGLGLFVRSLVGLDHQAALEAFAHYLDGSKFNANQLHFINLIVGELTNNGVMAPARLYESPYTELAITGPESMFTEDQVDNIVSILNTVRANAQPVEGVA
jgi:type I restriction enzyme R subunit